MAGMFYSLKEVMGKLKKTEDEVSALVKQGRLREFRDGPNLLFKIDEVESLMSDTTFMAAQKVTEKPQEEEVPLILDEEDKGKPAGKTDADATEVASEGINVLGETDAEISLTEDTLAQTQAASSGATSIIDSALSSTKAASDEASLKEIEENVNLDTFGSGSGLLDLSLQADDTSLGGILDEIYTPGEEGKEAAKEGSVAELAEEAEQIAEKPQEAPAGEMEAEIAATAAMAGPEAVAYAAEPAADTASNIIGYMLFIPLLATVYTIIVALIGQGNINSPILGVKGLIWPIVGGAAVVSVLFVIAGVMMGGPKKPKVKKEKKAKKAKKGEPQAVAAPAAQVAAATEVADGTTQAATAESADLSGFGAGGEEDLKLDDLDLSDVKEVKEDEDKL